MSTINHTWAFFETLRPCGYKVGHCNGIAGNKSPFYVKLSPKHMKIGVWINFTGHRIHILMF